MTTKEMESTLYAIYTQIRKEQKREEYENIVTLVDEIHYLLCNELGCWYSSIGTDNTTDGTFDF